MRHFNVYSTKKYYIVLLIFMLSICIAFANDTTPSTLNEVTVYLDGAQITRTVSLKLPIGTTEFTFDKLSPDIQESSIQISGLKNTTILSINYGINYLSKQNYKEDINKLQNRIENLQDNIQLEDDLIAGFNEEISIIQKNGHLSSDIQVVNLEKLKELAAYYRKRLTEIKQLIHTSNKKKAHFKKEITEIEQQLAEFNVDDKLQTGEIKVKLNTEVANQLNLVIKYNVSNAGWFPIYDLKAEKINAPLQLAYKAHVYQNTGNDWDDVKLTLSTSDPNTNNIKPEMNPKYLNFISLYSNYKSNRATKSYNYKYNPLVKTVSGVVVDESGLPLPGVTVIEKGTTNGTSTDFDGKYSLKTSRGRELVYSYIGYKTDELPIHSSIMNVSLAGDAEALDEVVIVAYGAKRKYKEEENNDIELTSKGDVIEQGITNTRFEIKKQYSIKTDGDITVIEIDNYTLPATYAYFAAPLLNENVFLTAKIGDWEQHNLLPAEANVYFEGSYSGKTHINPQATTDSLTVSLGVDPNVVIKREQMNDFKKKNFTGSNKIINKAYEIEVKNNKLSAIDLILVDRIPISQNKDIKIDDIEYDTANYDTKKGLLEWKINLVSKTSKVFKFSYILKYPKYKHINL